MNEMNCSIVSEPPEDMKPGLLNAGAIGVFFSKSFIFFLSETIFANFEGENFSLYSEPT